MVQRAQRLLAAGTRLLQQLLRLLLGGQYRFLLDLGAFQLTLLLAEIGASLLQGGDILLAGGVEVAKVGE